MLYDTLFKECRVTDPDYRTVSAQVLSDVFMRVDRDDPDAWKQELANVRFLTDENMSGSAQFSVNQFRALVPELRKQAEDIWIVDCRLETHGFINGIAVSWCNGQNNTNAGKTGRK